MPNHVSHKITFDGEHAERVFAAVCPEGCFDFEKLIPSPPQIYKGDLSADDERDFPCNWFTWSRDNWGTKWNAYSGSCEVVEGKAVIKFDTAWSVPYPVISAFANAFNIPFEHRYFDEGRNYWGIEKWGNRDRIGQETPFVCRMEKRYSDPKDERALCIELQGYDPEAIEEEV